MSQSTIRLLQPGDEASLENFLRPWLASSMFLLSNMRKAGLADQGDRLQGTYAARFQGDQMVGVIAHYNNGNLLPQLPLTLNSPNEVEALWRFAVHASRRPIHGMVGPGDQVALMLDLLNVTAAHLQMDASEILFTLDLANLNVPALLSQEGITSRKMQMADLDLTTQWRVAYTAETLGEAESPELWQRSREGIERSCREGATWLLEVNSLPVAMSSFNAAVTEAVQVGGVFTPPEQRGRGYARAVVAASLLEARTTGVQQGILFTGETNHPAQRAYVSIGFEPIGSFGLALFREPIAPE